MELLAPVGTHEALIAAVQSGADAVYLGGVRFSARGSAGNFDEEELKNCIEYCHKRGVSVHVAANTLIKEDECNDFLDYLGYLNDIGTDAVIIQDLGMASASLKLYPKLPLHASTQLTCASLDSARFLENMGFSRIVLARELDLKSIEKISRNISIETEVFVHGAICMSYSGQCLMSSMIGGRSGNRGHCAQPCRLPYNLRNNGKNVNKGYLLSPKDMCLVNHLYELSKVGVNSLKIEGRLKRAEYVSAVTGVYRRCIDENRKAYDEEINELLDAFNRSGFTDGYFSSRTGKGMMSYKNPSNISENKFTAEATDRCKIGQEFKKIPINIECFIEIGKPVKLTIKDFDGNTVSVTGNINVEKAVNKPLTPDRVKAQLVKLGQTVYTAVKADISIANGAAVAVSEINNLRREAADKLDMLRAAIPLREKQNVKFEFENHAADKTEISAMCRTDEQVRVCIEEGIQRIYAPSSNKAVITALPPVDREGKKLSVDTDNSVIISSYGQIPNKNGAKYSADFRLNVTNSYTLQLFKNCETVTLSPELTINELSRIKKSCDTEIIAYGRIPLMTFENCPVRANGKCDRGKNENTLTDRMNEEFPLVCTQGCFCVLLNSKPLYMADRINDLKKIGAKYIRLDFTVETPQECRAVISEYKKALDGVKADERKENTFTRGHFYKKTE